MLSKTIAFGNLFYDVVSFSTGNGTFHHKMFQEITDTYQIHQLEFYFLIIRHISAGVVRYKN